MPPSEANNKAYKSPPGQSLAVVAESLYLLNLLLLPGLAFIALVIIYLRTVRNAPPLALCHLRQTLSASIWAGVVLVVINALIIAFGGYNAPYTWMFVLLYFTACHSTLILLGTLGLAKAMAGKAWRYPLVGRACPELQVENHS
jgi:uncharacterized Tic20 family protein